MGDTTIRRLVKVTLSNIAINLGVALVFLAVGILIENLRAKQKLLRRINYWLSLLPGLSDPIRENHIGVLVDYAQEISELVDIVNENLNTKYFDKMKDIVIKTSSDEELSIEDVESVRCILVEQRARLKLRKRG